jgi:predicted dehydrogenase
LDYFATCIKKGHKPEPDGEQGLRDIIIIDAIYRAARKGGSVRIKY